MADKLTPARRSANMSRIRNRDTVPEMQVRKVAHAMGYRFRLHRKDLPGKPDLVFPGRKAAILVHGCFWHQHPDPECKNGRRPKTRLEYWDPKLDGNLARDRRNIEALEALGWRVLVLWECETEKPGSTAAALETFLGPPGTGTDTA